MAAGPSPHAERHMGLPELKLDGSGPVARKGSNPQSGAMH